MSVTTTERDLYADLWGTAPNYADHSPGVQVLPIFLDIVGKDRGHVLDAGCGSGKAGVALDDAGFRVTLCDLTDAGLVAEATAMPFKTSSLWHSLRRILPTGAVDWVYCTDVLEHLPTQFTMLAVEQMLRVARCGVFLSISVQPDRFGVWVGQPLHQTVQSYRWWHDSLSELGPIRDARDLMHAATFYVDRQ